jgi:hypothetical protein
MKTIIEINTEDTHELNALCDIVSGYLNKKGIEFEYQSYTKFKDGRQMMITKYSD